MCLCLGCLCFAVFDCSIQSRYLSCAVSFTFLVALHTFPSGLTCCVPRTVLQFLRGHLWFDFGEVNYARLPLWVSVMQSYRNVRFGGFLDHVVLTTSIFSLRQLCSDSNFILFIFLFSFILGCGLPLQDVALRQSPPTFLSFAILVYSVPRCLTMSSLRRRFGLATHLIPFIYHSINTVFHSGVVCSQFPFPFVFVLDYVCHSDSLPNDGVTDSVFCLLCNIFLSLSHSVVSSFFTNDCVRDCVWDLYVTSGKTHWLKTFGIGHANETGCSNLIFILSRLINIQGRESDLNDFVNKKIATNIRF